VIGWIVRLWTRRRLKSHFVHVWKTGGRRPQNSKRQRSRITWTAHSAIRCNASSSLRSASSNHLLVPPVWSLVQGRFRCPDRLFGTVCRLTLRLMCLSFIICFVNLRQSPIIVFVLLLLLLLLSTVCESVAVLDDLSNCSVIRIQALDTTTGVNDHSAL